MNDRSNAISAAIDVGIANTPEEWKQDYLLLCWVLLQQQQFVSGDDFKTFCKLRGLPDPDTHNRWVGMPVVLEKLGWVSPLGWVAPHRNHNHMPQVTLYRSNLFNAELRWKA